MKRSALVGTVVFLCIASTAFAQRNTSRSSYAATTGHRAEIIPLGGYAWTMSMDVYNGLTAGTLDFEDSGFWGIAVDVNANRGSQKTAQLRLLYRREDSKVTFRSLSLSGDADAAVEYWHIGGVGGVERGNAMPFTSVTVGGTRLIADGEDEWKFSLILGLGVKVYLSPKMGLMLQGNWPFTFTDTWGGVTVGTGGAGVAVGGTGISQLDVGGGLIICF